jgi:ribosomal-protein-alanine N-acetyltransferase
VKLHHPWYSMPTTREAFQTYLAKFSQPTAEGFLVCLRDGGTLAGMVTIDSIITREMTDFPPVDPHPTLPAR